MLNIKAVSQATGIDPVTLRAWERRYGVPNPGRSETGYRLYSERDVAILNWLKARVDSGVNIRRAVAMLRSQLPQAPEPVRRSPGWAGQGAASFDELVDALLEAAHRFDGAQAQQIITRAFALFPVEDVGLNVLFPALARIGEQWRQGDASLQVEHFLTNIIRQQLLAVAATMPAPTRPGRLVIGCAPAEWHEMSALLISIFMQRKGWHVVYLGQAVGLERLEQTLETVQPDVVLMTANTFLTVGGLAEAGDLVQRVSRGRAKFVFGGVVFTDTPGLADRLPGLYIGSTLSEAVERLEALLTAAWTPPLREGLHVNGRVMQTRQALQLATWGLAADLASELLTIRPDTFPEAAADDAHQILAAVDVALRFDFPVFRATAGTSLDHTLALYDLRPADLIPLFARHLDEQHMEVLARLL
ncbi:MAG: hypothetical protein Kow00124_22940 [Anaerolineae bacterium]